MKSVFLVYRRAFVIAAHLAMWTASLYSAFLLRFDFAIPGLYLHNIPRWLIPLLVVRSAVHAAFGLFHGLWRYSSSRDLIGLVKAALVSTALFALVVTLLGPTGLPRSVYVMDLLGSIVIVGGVRFSIRAIRELAVQAAGATSGGRKKLIVVGAGDAGEMLMREITRTHSAKYEPVGFVDDSRMKLGERIHGVPVLGEISSIGRLVESLGVEEVILAIPSLSGKDMRRIVDMCATTKARVRTLPGVDRLIDGRVMVSQLQSVKIEDLLGRALVTAEVLELPAVIVFNKTDLTALATVARERLRLYEALGYPVVPVSVRGAPEATSAALLPLLHGQTTLLLGQSGMGKSTLLNLLVPDADAATREISQALQSGKHTTTFTRQYELRDAAGAKLGALIDTPGFQEFGLAHFTPGQIERAFPEMGELLGHCRFYNCTHLAEPGCAVRTAAQQGAINPRRLELFERLTRECGTNK